VEYRSSQQLSDHGQGGTSEEKKRERSKGSPTRASKKFKDLVEEDEEMQDVDKQDNPGALTYEFLEQYDAGNQIDERVFLEKEGIDLEGDFETWTEGNEKSAGLLKEKK